MNEPAIAIHPRTASIVPSAGADALKAAEQAYRGLLADEPKHLRALCGLAAVRSQLGAEAEARELLTQAVGVARPSAEDQIALGTAFRRIKDLDNARRHFESAVALDQDHAEPRIQLANIHLLAGRIEDAIAQYQAALDIDLNNADVHQALGLALQRLRQFQSAIPHHEKALAIKPRFALAHVSLGDAHRHLERHDEAIAQYQRALAINPQLTDAYVNLGGTLHLIGRREEAIAIYQAALLANPNLADAHYNLGNLYSELDNLQAAIFHYGRAVELRPTSAESHNNLGNALQKRGRHQEAIAHYRTAIRLKPNDASTLRNMGDAWRSLHRFDKAIASYRAALTSDPTDITAMNHLGGALMITGQIEDAARVYEAALKIQPQNVGVHFNYATAKRFVAGDPRLPLLEDLAAREAQLPDEGRIALHFTLGKAYADLRDGERSFQHLDIANRIERQHLTYDELSTLRLFDRIRDAFTKDILRTRSGAGHRSEAPIFVVGMPRSGTSLVEQILASHPRVYGAGEVNHFSTVTSSFAARSRTQYPEMFFKLSDEELRELGKTYLAQISAPAASAARIVDKMPANFLSLGLIHLALPEARIIHVKRDPIDTCLSCFSLLFAEGQPFAYDLAEVGHYYKAYEALMAHWRSVLPPGTMLEVQYEDLVGEMEGHARRLVRYCGLDWDDRCLSFHQTKRPVQTASLVQVREPVHSKSVGRWRLYGARLKPLLDALDIDAPAPEPVKSSSPVPAGAENFKRAKNRAENWVERAYQLGTTLQQRGKLKQAERLLLAVLAVRPDHFGSLLALGSLYANSNRLDEAKSYFQQMIAAHPNFAEAHGSLGALRGTRGELDAAVVCYEKALSLAPYHPGIHYGYSSVLQSIGKSAKAIEHLRFALAVRPDHLESHFALGNLLYAADRLDEALRCYQQVLRFNPRHAETHNNIANTYLKLGQRDRAISHYKTAQDANPSYADAFGNLGNAYLELNRLEESIEQNRLAIARNPTRFGSFNNLGVAYQALGQFEEASWAFERALELSPDEASVHLNLANMQKFAADDRRLPGLRRLIERIDTLDNEQKLSAHFAMGKALSDLKQYDEAFAHLKQANALKRRTFDYDEGQRLAMFRNIEAKYTPELFAAKSGSGDTSWSPIFIVGMPRSGTTLLEQVLASHSRVFGAGELETFKEAINECVESQRILPAYPLLVDFLAPEHILRIGQTYTTQVRALAPDAPHVVDKMPLNFMFVGLIHLALPNARIIHIRRDPLDTCVSCYSLLFTGSQPFAYDLAELGHYYRGYEQVMAHWHKVLPPGVLMDVQYEDLVADLEGVSRGALAHCGLEWEDACRDFHDTKRSVRTASTMQVREPLYSRSIGSWRRYEKHLGPLFEALGRTPKA
ncbi:sulfotransferase [Bradyrhizobium sp.]|uniref:sulfotransferase n=1 Tax=Bradyrhizobium sp. TaxID=376 RepID=UPI001EB16820|nr:sulfotransferase family protein [Bradyrhizobium sp.]MBV8921420.1 tetratricopeptide repeat protein [Bradyrhizobium sp.]MBV9978897.1 tetratricopeptide repeat protein [Bradyrhizobium sp.]